MLDNIERVRKRSGHHPLSLLQGYNEELTKQLGEEDDIDSMNLEAVDLSLANLKEVSASWLVEAADRVSENLLFIVNGFHHSKITAAVYKAIAHRSDDSKEV